MTQSSISDDEDAHIEETCEEFKTNCLKKYEYDATIISIKYV